MLKSIAKRRNVKPGSPDRGQSRHRPPEEASAVTDLLANDMARIGAGTMNKIIDVAPQHDDWHITASPAEDLTSDNMRRVAEIPLRRLPETMSARTISIRQR